MGHKRTDPRVRGVYLAEKRERSGEKHPVLRVNWVSGKKARRTTVSIDRHGLDAAVRIAVGKIRSHNRLISFQHVSEAVRERAAELGISL